MIIHAVEVKQRAHHQSSSVPYSSDFLISMCLSVAFAMMPLDHFLGDVVAALLAQPGMQTQHACNMGLGWRLISAFTSSKLILMSTEDFRS